MHLDRVIVCACGCELIGALGYVLVCALCCGLVCAFSCGLVCAFGYCDKFNTVNQHFLSSVCICLCV